MDTILQILIGIIFVLSAIYAENKLLRYFAVFILLATVALNLFFISIIPRLNIVDPNVEGSGTTAFKNGALTTYVLVRTSFPYFIIAASGLGILALRNPKHKQKDT
jgi:hypothetical protein